MINIKSRFAHLMRTLTGRQTDREIPVETNVERKVEAASTTTPRVTRRETDIPLDQIENTYSPNQTSLKAPFRTDGADHERDQEFAGGIADDRWNDEDRFTNKSGDPRIGTHGRTYEPGEASADRKEGGR